MQRRYKRKEKKGDKYGLQQQKLMSVVKYCSQHIIRFLWRFLALDRYLRAVRSEAIQSSNTRNQMGSGRVVGARAYTERRKIIRREKKHLIIRNRDRYR